MKIISNKKWEELKELEETNIKLGNQIMQDAETIKKLRADKRVIANEYQNKIDGLNNEIRQLEKKLNFANKEIEDLKKNVRKACNCNNNKSESIKNKTTKKVVKEETPKKTGRKPKNEQ